MDTIRGKIDKVAYFDDAKLFGIVKLKIDYKDEEMAKFRSMLFTNIVSVLSSFDRKPIIDEEYSFDGEFEESMYGMQFRAKSFSRNTAETYEGIVSYFSSDIFPTIGKATAEKIYDALGDKCIEMILNDKSCLKDVPITNKQKDIIYECLVKEQENRDAQISLLSIGFSLAMANKLIRILGDGAGRKIKENPYILMYEVEGFGFLKADGVAQRIGIDKHSPMRLKALVHYSIAYYLNSSGDTFIDKNDLVMKIFHDNSGNGEEEISIDEINEYLTTLEQEGRIYTDTNNNVYTHQTYADEVKLSSLVAKALKYETEKFKDESVEMVLENVMHDNHIEYSPKQKEAILKAISEPIVIITGGPGTGKSTIIKGIVDTFAGLHKYGDAVSDGILLCAPTGRAAKRLKEVTLHSASTIHKLLGYTGNGHFEFNEENKLDGQMVIVDEFSMVDQNLARRLFEAIKENTKIVIVGDANQLPSVQSGNVLLDLINTKEITTITLDQIHRQKEGSSIITLAHEIKEGVLPYDIYDAKEDRRFIQKKDDEIIPFVLQTVEKGISSGMDMIKDIQVLVPTYKGEIGIEAMNKAMQERFNPTGTSVNKMGRTFRVKDKVIQLINRSDKGIMNGDIGYIEEIVYVDKKFINMTVVFDIGRVDYSYDDIDELTLAYAVSIHKAQGSEFGLVIVPFSFKFYHMLKRKLIYTACTRAKKYLILIGNIESLRRGVVEIEEERKTLLTERIKDQMENEVEVSVTDEECELTPFDFL